MRGAKLSELIDARLAKVLGGEPTATSEAKAGPSVAGGVEVNRSGAPSANSEPDMGRPLPALRFGSRQAGVIALLLFIAVALTWWWVSQAKAASVPVLTASSEPANPAVTATPIPSSSQATPPTAGSTPGSGILVHVVGAVKRPGVVELPAGARVQAAIEEAGGLTSDAELGQLNLAAPVTDGAQVVVGSKNDPTSEVRTAPQAPAAEASTGLVNLNAATSAQLQELPGVGPVTADAIIGWREANGPFARTEDLLNVDGIGDKTYAKLAPLVTV